MNDRKVNYALQTDDVCRLNHGQLLIRWGSPEFWTLCCGKTLAPRAYKAEKTSFVLFKPHKPSVCLLESCFQNIPVSYDKRTLQRHRQHRIRDHS